MLNGDRIVFGEWEKGGGWPTTLSRLSYQAALCVMCLRETPEALRLASESVSIASSSVTSRSVWILQEKLHRHATSQRGLSVPYMQVSLCILLSPIGILAP